MMLWWQSSCQRCPWWTLHVTAQTAPSGQPSGQPSRALPPSPRSPDRVRYFAVSPAGRSTARRPAFCYSARTAYTAPTLSIVGRRSVALPYGGGSLVVAQISQQLRGPWPGGNSAFPPRRMRRRVASARPAAHRSRASLLPRTWQCRYARAGRLGRGAVTSCAASARACTRTLCCTHRTRTPCSCSCSCYCSCYCSCCMPCVVALTHHAGRRPSLASTRPLVAPSVAAPPPSPCSGNAVGAGGGSWCC